MNIIIHYIRTVSVLPVIITYFYLFEGGIALAQVTITPPTRALSVLAQSGADQQWAVTSAGNPTSAFASAVDGPFLTTSSITRNYLPSSSGFSEALGISLVPGNEVSRGVAASFDVFEGSDPTRLWYIDTISGINLRIRCAVQFERPLESFPVHYVSIFLTQVSGPTLLSTATVTTLSIDETLALAPGQYIFGCSFHVTTYDGLPNNISINTEVTHDYISILPAVSLVRNDNGTFRVDFVGTLETSTDLKSANWVTMDPQPTSPYIFTPEPGVPRLFFRARQ